MNVTLLPVPAERVEHRPYVDLALLQVADVFLTGLLLTLFTQAAEGNPVARVLTDRGHLGLGVLLGLKLAVCGLLWYCQTPTRLASALYTAVVVNNVLALWLLVGS